MFAAPERRQTQWGTNNVVLLDWLADARNRLFASRRFQSVAVAVPGVRRVANRRAGRLFDVTAGFVYSQILRACVDLELFERLSNGARDLDELSAEVDVPAPALMRLARAAAGLDLLAVRRDRLIALGPQGAALVANPSVFAMVRHHQLLYRDLSDPVALLRQPRGSGELAQYWAYAGAQDAGALEPGRVDAYSDLMAATQGFIAQDVLSAYPIARHRHVMDVGGGKGAFLSAVGQAAPRVDLTLFDLPAVTASASAAIEDPALAGRMRFAGGDFHKDPLPAGADLVTLIRILHDHDEADVASLLKNVWRSLEPGGRVLIAEPMAGTRGARAMGDAYFGMYLWAMGRGEPRPPHAYRALLEAAGFTAIKRHRARRPLLTSVMSATKG